MIHPQRLNRYITSRECMNAVDYMIEVIDKMSVAQRLEIKNLLYANKNTNDRQIYNRKFSGV